MSGHFFGYSVAAVIHVCVFLSMWFLFTLGGIDSGKTPPGMLLYTTIAGVAVSGMLFLTVRRLEQQASFAGQCGVLVVQTIYLILFAIVLLIALAFVDIIIVSG